jgi:NAD(P) transhydrogenase subunit beta
LRELANALEERGVTVKFAIHPVAGRMPGHMNVLLAEANVPYSQLYELEQINPDFPLTDVALVVGANDVVNPDARDNPGSPISGMPILEVDHAKSVVVLKRGHGRGFSGLENPLFALPNCGMLYGDAKETLTQLVQAARKA